MEKRWLLKSAAFSKASQATLTVSLCSNVSLRLDLFAHFAQVIGKGEHVFGGWLSWPPGKTTKPDLIKYLDEDRACRTAHLTDESNYDVEGSRMVGIRVFQCASI